MKSLAKPCLLLHSKYGHDYPGAGCTQFIVSCQQRILILKLTKKVFPRPKKGPFPRSYAHKLTALSTFLCPKS